MPNYIQSKKDLKQFLKVELGIVTKYCSKWFIRFCPFLIYEEQIKYKFIKYLRMAEFHSNLNHRIRGFIYRMKHYKMQVKYCLNIPMNCCDIGLNIAHVGPIIINDNCIIGKNFKVNVGVNIGNNEFKNHVECPKIGNNVYIGPGAKLYGNIVIADGCRIGANAVVNKSCEIPNVVLAGIPATIKNYTVK